MNRRAKWIQQEIARLLIESAANKDPALCRVHASRGVRLVVRVLKYQKSICRVKNGELFASNLIVLTSIIHCKIEPSEPGNPATPGKQLQSMIGTEWIVAS